MKKEEVIGVLSGDVIIGMGHICDENNERISQKDMYEHIAIGNVGFFRKIKHKPEIVRELTPDFETQDRKIIFNNCNNDG